MKPIFFRVLIFSCFALGIAQVKRILHGRQDIHERRKSGQACDGGRKVLKAIKFVGSKKTSEVEHLRSKISALEARIASMNVQRQARNTHRRQNGSSSRSRSRYDLNGRSFFHFRFEKIYQPKKCLTLLLEKSRKQASAVETVASPAADEVYLASNLICYR
ncbi:hypothetical protein TNIN_255141 [Trichonephila inaurata madagascariensis]|uniref:Uncharacterized protein n=1 Tax=Trichonephila inaurata madagascariensis TaxID=2747483 RepID=A0A8X6XRH1_9ARAC|nr:hypothetical protein TNIN_255141 [Trichonephila inaurata madagascariensis]